MSPGRAKPSHWQDARNHTTTKSLRAKRDAPNTCIRIRWLIQVRTSPLTLTLGIDLGTQSLKALVYDADAKRVLARASSPLALNQREDGTAEQEAAWWTRAFLEAMSQIDASAKSSVSAIGVSGQQHGLVVLDANRRVLAPVKLWCDTSTGDQCQAIMTAVGGEARCIELAGNPILPGYTASKLKWLKDHRRETYDQVRYVLLPHDYMNLALTGELCMEMGDASGTAFFDVHRRTWSEELLTALDPDRDLGECLPELRRQNTEIGRLMPAVAAETGLPKGIPVSIGGGDNMMAAIGTGNLSSGRMTLSLGTSGTLFAYSDTPIVDMQGQIAAFCSSTGGWLPLLCTMNCTVATELTRQLFEMDIEELEQQVAAVPPGSGGLLTLPFYQGERTPNLPKAKGCLLGLDAHNMSPKYLLRSAIEGASLALRSGLDEFQRLGMRAQDIRLTGGGAQSGTWRQIVADLFDCPVQVPVESEGAAFGAALQALELTCQESLQAITETRIAFDQAMTALPSPESVSTYGDIFERYRKAVDSISPLYA